MQRLGDGREHGIDENSEALVNSISIGGGERDPKAGERIGALFAKGEDESSLCGGKINALGHAIQGCSEASKT